MSISKKIFLFLFLFFSHSVIAQQTVSPLKCLSYGSMPVYRIDFSIEHPEKDDLLTRFLVLRFYQNQGDGSFIDWQQPVTIPEVSLNGKPISLTNFFSFTNQDMYHYGSMGLGFDQFAQYYATFIPNDQLKKKNTLIIGGAYSQVSYMSAVLYTGADILKTEKDFDNHHIYYQKSIVDKDFPTTPTPCNPYLFGNPTVMSYNSVLSQKPTQALNTQPSLLNLKDHHSKSILIGEGASPESQLAMSKDESTGKVGVYRLSQVESLYDNVDGINESGCSDAYLSARKPLQDEVMILRIKVPTTLFASPHKDLIYRSYQVDYFSVSADTFHDYLSFWTVNAKMLNKIKDKNGYAYVFSAPSSYAQKIAEETQTPPNEAPLIQWGNYRGYLLGNADYAMILRYKNADKNWIGSPSHAVCYKNSLESHPITTQDLGEYTPEVYSDSLEHFLSGHIGSVDQNQEWPSF